MIDTFVMEELMSGIGIYGKHITAKGENYSTVLSGRTFSYWDYFDQTIKRTGSTDCVIVTDRVPFMCFELAIVKCGWLC